MEELIVSKNFFIISTVILLVFDFMKGFNLNLILTLLMLFMFLRPLQTAWNQMPNFFQILSKLIKLQCEADDNSKQMICLQSEKG